MKIYLENINKENVVDNIDDFDKKTVLKAIEMLIKENLAVETKDMSTYKCGERVGWWSSLADRKEQVECYKKEIDKKNYLIKWYFSPEIKNICSKIKSGFIE